MTQRDLFRGVQETSVEVYRREVVPTLGRRHREVLAALEMAPFGLTNTELSKTLGWSINRVTPRVNELRKKGRVIELMRRPCRITGRRAIVWGARHASGPQA